MKEFHEILLKLQSEVLGSPIITISNSSIRFEWLDYHIEQSLDYIAHFTICELIHRVNTQYVNRKYIPS